MTRAIAQEWRPSRFCGLSDDDPMANQSGFAMPPVYHIAERGISSPSLTSGVAFWKCFRISTQRRVESRSQVGAVVNVREFGRVVCHQLTRPPASQVLWVGTIPSRAR